MSGAQVILLDKESHCYQVARYIKLHYVSHVAQTEDVIHTIIENHEIHVYLARTL